MSGHDYHIVMIIPAATKDKANRLGRADGRDGAADPGQTFSVPLSADGRTITHYGAWTVGRKDFIDHLTESKRVPPQKPRAGEYADYNTSRTDAVAVMAGMVVDVEHQPGGTPEQRAAHVAAVLKAQGLVKYEAEHPHG